MAFATIDYDEPKQSTFRAIEISYLEGKKEVVKRFETGDPVYDYYDYMKWIVNLPKSFWKQNQFIVWSSSKDHFFMDGNKYSMKYVNVKTSEFYTNAELDAMSLTELDGIARCITTDKFKTFQQVKDYYNKQTEALKDVTRRKRKQRAVSK